MQSELVELFKKAPEQLVLDYLTPEMLDLLNAITLENIIVIIANYGGSHLCVPKVAAKKITGGHYDFYSNLLSLIGEKSTESLIKYAGGLTYEIPRCNKLKVAMRNNSVIEALESGKKSCEIAKTLGMTARNVRHIKAKHKLGKKHEIQST